MEQNQSESSECPNVLSYVLSLVLNAAFCFFEWIRIKCLSYFDSKGSLHCSQWVIAAPEKTIGICVLLLERRKAKQGSKTPMISAGDRSSVTQQPSCARWDEAQRYAAAEEWYRSEIKQTLKLLSCRAGDERTGGRLVDLTVDGPQVNLLTTRGKMFQCISRIHQ